MERYFYCYSPRLKNALVANGFRYICVGINEKENSKFWLFEGTDELNAFKNEVYQKARDQY